MFATKHAVFIGPGRLPKELRDVLLKRAHAPQPDLVVNVPRMLAIFETAAEAERVASQVQRLKIGAMVAGPEQPPAASSWSLATSLEFFGDSWRYGTLADTKTLHAKDVASLAIVDWRVPNGPADRGVLVRLRDGALPIFLRASAITPVSQRSTPVEGLKRLHEFLDACALEGAPDLRVRQRKLTPNDLRDDELEGDLLPLAVAMVDAVDSQHAPLSRPLSADAAASPIVAAPRSSPAVYSGSAEALAWFWYAVPLAAALGSLGLLTFSVFTFDLPGLVLGSLYGFYAGLRFLWSRWLATMNWGNDSPVPAWPLNASEAGRPPLLRELALEATLIAVAAWLRGSDGVVPRLAWATLIAMGPLTLAALATAWEHHQRRED